MSVGRTVEGAGCVTWWGFGPARDLLNSENTVRSDGELNVLLVGSGDPRHILKTITGLTDSDTLHVWVIENNMEVEKTEVFLEVFGNSEIRKETEETLKHAAAQLSLSITNTLSWTRYDSRQGCFDWDLSMKLHQRGCDIISKHQYVKWRESGVAFEMREGLYQTANQSRGDRVAVRGYWGDIVSGPYLSFGIETENKDTARDISEVNVLALFECLATRESSLLNEDVPNPSSSCCQSTDILRVFSIYFGFLYSLNKLPLKNKYRNLFNSIFCSASMVHQLDSSLREIAAPDAALVIELANFLLDLSKEQVSGFADRVKEIAEESGFTATHDQSSDSHSFRYTLYKHTLHYISHIHLM
ncbi:hypothetical protein PO909_017441 [Leuciscus waleckii]